MIKWENNMVEKMEFRGRVVALAGGVGGARLTHGLVNLLPPDQLSIVVNTGDDFEHLGLTICPDLDTVTYTLAGLANPGSGWGIEGDTFSCLDALQRLGGATWFRLGDRDLATHIMRTNLLRQGRRLTEVTHIITTQLGIRHALLPMCDTPLRTMVLTDQGEMDFQTYFVREAFQPVVKGFRWEGIEEAKPTLEVMAAINSASLVILCPSNPFVSIDPILNLPGVRPALAKCTILAVSPILGGKVVKGPAAKMFRELGFEASAANVARHYMGLLSGFVLDEIDTDLVEEIQQSGIAARAMPSLMPGIQERITVARRVLEFGLELQAEKKA
jgi:LPPG:FO 2-phospho-L-lactate transferase